MDLIKIQQRKVHLVDAGGSSTGNRCTEFAIGGGDVNFDGGVTTAVNDLATGLRGTCNGRHRI